MLLRLDVVPDPVEDSEIESERWVELSAAVADALLAGSAEPTANAAMLAPTTVVVTAKA